MQKRSMNRQIKQPEAGISSAEQDHFFIRLKAISVNGHEIYSARNAAHINIIGLRLEKGLPHHIGQTDMDRLYSFRYAN